MHALRLDGVCHAYGDRIVLDAFGLSVASHEVVAITGPSGSGKSTLLSLAGLLRKPQAGTVSIGAIDDVWSKSRKARLGALRSVGWVFQTMNVLAHRTVIDNVSLPLLAAGTTRAAAEHVADSLLGDFGLASLRNRVTSTLSGGEVQRACIARALSVSPVLLVADEPTGQLDRGTTDEVARALRTAAQLGAGVLVATHDPRVARRADRIVHLQDEALRGG